MKFYLSDKILNLTKLRKQNVKWKKTMGVLSIVAVLFTFYVLISPAITLSEKYYCEKEEHVHTDACYEIIEQDVLICKDEEKIRHEHTDDCYEINTTFKCNEESVKKSDDELIESEVQGSKEELSNEVAVDEDSINDAELSVKEDSEIHEHTDECEKIVENKLVCQEEEEVHEHTNECYTTESSITDKLICTLELHEHEKLCKSNKNADLENENEWKKSVLSFTNLSGDWRIDLTNVAKSQIGYVESGKNFIVDEFDDLKGITRYGQWYGEPYEDWNEMFVSFCLSYAKIPETVIPYHSNSQSWIENLKNINVYRTLDTDLLASGDLIFIHNKETDSYRVGIVENNHKSVIKSIEGDLNKQVNVQTYSIDDESIVGFVSMDDVFARGVELGVVEPIKEPVDEEHNQQMELVIEEDLENEEANEDTIILKTEYDGKIICLEASKDALPNNDGEFTLSVKKPDEKILNQLKDAVDADLSYFVLDIDILCDGKVVQPLSGVKVSVEMNDDSIIKTKDVEVYHVIEDDELEILDMQKVNGEKNKKGEIVIETNHFSTYVITESNEEYNVSAIADESYADQLTNRSNDIGVTTEGYADSPYKFEKKQSYLTNIWAAVNNLKTGGTFYLDRRCNQAEKYWDGSKPFRITSAKDDRAILWFSMYSDLVLDGDTGDLPYAALKIDNIDLRTSFSNPDIHARGNKLVIGENVTTEENTRWRLFGGATQYDSSDEDTASNTRFITNVIVNSGTWDYVFGGGLRDTNYGTQVTIRGNANVNEVYGGGHLEGDINNLNQLDSTINVYVEGGKVGTVYGGNNTTQTGLKVNGNIKIDVSGGTIQTILAGNNHSNIDGTDELKGSKVRGGAVVNIYNTGSVKNVIGDYLHYDSLYGDQLITFKGPLGEYKELGRHIRNLTELNIHSNNDFDMMDYWDIVRINNKDEQAEPNSVVVSSKQLTLGIGNLSANVGSQYIGRMEVTNGGQLYLKNNTFINYMNEVKTTSDEGGDNSFDLTHAWMGESEETRRAWSTLKIEGSCIKQSTAATNLFTLTNPRDNGQAGLRIKGTVEGYSTLIAAGTPMYSTGDKYYYYVVADASETGGKAFKEPEGADYVVCYRYLDDNRIGWYLRERPTLTMDNTFVRVGYDEALTLNDEGTYSEYPAHYTVLHVDLKGFAYEWSSNPDKNRVDFSWIVKEGFENATEVEVHDLSGISITTMADVENNLLTTDNPDGLFANVVYDAMGSDEGSSEQSKRLSSFDIILDIDKAINPRYYEVASNFHYIQNDGDYDDIRVGQVVDAARCTYDFAKTDELLGTDDYVDSVMTTYDYENNVPPKGNDDALLRVYLPEGVTAESFSVNENDDQFVFEQTGKHAELVDSSSVSDHYETDEESTYNHYFAVTLSQLGVSESDLADGLTMHDLSGKESYHCAVYSYENIDYTDISMNDSTGLQLYLQLENLTKQDQPVGNSDPSTINNGELRIQVCPVGTIIETTKIHVKKIVTVDGEENNDIFEFVLSYHELNDEDEEVLQNVQFTLTHNEEKTFMVPLEKEVVIEEINHDGYYTQVQKNNESQILSDEITVVTPNKEQAVGNDMIITFYNSPGTEIPKTGGIGNLLYTILGMILIAGSFVFEIKKYYGRRA